MKKIIVNMKKEEVTVFNERRYTWETCSFHEAEISEDPDVYSEEEIEEHLILGNVEEVEVVFI
jgi:hypothetical protein